MKVLMADVGGSAVKVMVQGRRDRIKLPSGPRFTPSKLVRDVLQATKDWKYDAISLGYPGVVIEGRPAIDPPNLGGGWVGFDYAKAFGKPVHIMNDAALQALGNYRRGRMLFLGLGTGAGCTLITEDTIVPMDIGILRLKRNATFKDRLSDEALELRGLVRWSRSVHEVVDMLRDVFKPEVVVLGGGNAKRVTPVPRGCLLRNGRSAFRGALRLWPGADMMAEPCGRSWRIRRPNAAHDRPGFGYKDARETRPAARVRGVGRGPHSRKLSG